MAHSFTIIITGEISDVLGKVRSEITGNGGRFDGSTESGSFDGVSALGLIKGEYRCIAGNELEIRITDKPFIVPYGIIESEIRRYFT